MSAVAGRPEVRGGRPTRGFPPGSAQALVALVLGVVAGVTGAAARRGAAAAFFAVARSAPSSWRGWCVGRAGSAGGGRCAPTRRAARREAASRVEWARRRRAAPVRHGKRRPPLPARCWHAARRVAPVRDGKRGTGTASRVGWAPGAACRARTRTGTRAGPASRVEWARGTACRARTRREARCAGRPTALPDCLAGPSDPTGPTDPPDPTARPPGRPQAARAPERRRRTPAVDSNA